MKGNKVSVADAKKNLSDLLGRVAYGGEEILITRRGNPMALLVPASAKGGLGGMRGWLENNDPFFSEMDKIVKNRKKLKGRPLPALGG